jgi:hypothetical protein
MAVETLAFVFEQLLPFHGIAQLNDAGAVLSHRTNISDERNEIWSWQIVRRHRRTWHAIANHGQQIFIGQGVAELPGVEIYSRYPTAVGVTLNALRTVDAGARVNFKLTVILLHLLCAERKSEEQKERSRDTEGISPAAAPTKGGNPCHL